MWLLTRGFCVENQPKHEFNTSGRTNDTALTLQYTFPIVHSLYSSWWLTNVQVGSEFCQQSLGQWDNHEISQDRSFSSLGPNRQSHSLRCEALLPFVLIYSSMYSACPLPYSFKEMRTQTLNCLSTIEFCANLGMCEIVCSIPFNCYLTTSVVPCSCMCRSRDCYLNCCWDSCQKKS